MIKKTFALSVLALSLSACTVGPNYHRPDLEMPRDWRNPSLVQIEEGNPVVSYWWQAFDDPQMNRLVEMALAENKDLRIAASRVDQYWAAYGITDADRYPYLGIGATGARTEYSRRTNPQLTQGVDTVRNDLQLALNASYEIDFWGKYRRASEAALADLFASEYAYDNITISLVASVVQNYIDLKALDAQLEVAQQTLQTRGEALRIQETRYRNGLTSELEYRQAEVEYRTALALIPSLESQIQQKENALSILIGRNPGEIIRGRSLEDMTVLPEVPAGLPSDLLARRPDIQQAEQNLIAANARIGVARAAYFPSISLTGLFGTQSAALSNLFSSPARIWQYGASVSLPIFDAGRISSNVALAEAQREEMLLAYEQTIQTAFREVNDALIVLQKLTEEYTEQQAQYQATARLMELAQKRYDAGYTSYLEVLDAQRSLYNIQSSMVTTHQARLNAFVTLNKVLGGGWLDINAAVQPPATATIVSGADAPA